MADLSLADLETFDPNAPRRGQERRFCCPICHGSRRKDASHRCLAVRVETGAWHCHRCGESGLLMEFRSSTPPVVPKRRRRLVSMPDPAPKRTVPAVADTAPKGYDFGAILRSLVSLEGTPGAAFLEGRSISLEVAAAARVRFAPDLFGKQAVVFALRDPDGRLVAVQARCSVPGDPWKRTLKATDGPHGGVFLTDPTALDAPFPVITEAPIDALTIAACGIPAIATVGTSFPDALAVRLAMRPVALAHDGDDPGDRAALAVAERVRELGGEPFRLRPPAGIKDWNDAARQYGLPALRAMLAPLFAPQAAEEDDLPSYDIQHTPTLQDAAEGNLEGLRAYSAEMGEIVFDAPTDVLIAGKVRKGIVWLHPRLVEVYAQADRVSGSRGSDHGGLGQPE